MRQTLGGIRRALADTRRIQGRRPGAIRRAVRLEEKGEEKARGKEEKVRQSGWAVQPKLQMVTQSVTGIMTSMFVVVTLTAGLSTSAARALASTPSMPALPEIVLREVEVERLRVKGMELLD